MVDPAKSIREAIKQTEVNHIEIKAAVSDLRKATNRIVRETDLFSKTRDRLDRMIQSVKNQ